MKPRHFLYVSIVLFLFSCRKEDESDLQKIDQIINIYISNAAGKDLLNTENTESFTSFNTQDLNADVSLKPFSGFTLKKDQDNFTYLDYASGAIRIMKNTETGTQKTYQSDFYINFLKTVNNQTETDTDTVKIEYSWSPNLFQVSKIWYNNRLSFTKKEGQPNIIKIVK